MTDKIYVDAERVERALYYFDELDVDDQEKLLCLILACSAEELTEFMFNTANACLDYDPTD
jgi:hypothetical protein